jgi:RNA polymerase sigma-70 factor (ECF subfamily)
MDEQQEREVARGLAAGNPDAWRALYDAHAERVWRAVARLMGPPGSDVADVVQETFLAAARSARTFDPGRGPLWVWMWGIARRHVALHYRKTGLQRRLLAQVAVDGRPDASDPLLALEAAALVRVTLTELPVEYEALLTAKYLDGEPVDRIAVRERSTEVAVRSKLARARQAFREAYAKHDRPAETKP